MSTGNPVILFDGFCNLCSGVVSFLLKRDKKKQFRFFPLQSETGRDLADQYKIPAETDSVVLISDSRFFVLSDAVIGIASFLPLPWKLVKYSVWIPKRMRDHIYIFVAKNRGRWFSRRTTCRIV